jgi:hypothetical protein
LGFWRRESQGMISMELSMTLQWWYNWNMNLNLMWISGNVLGILAINGKLMELRGASWKYEHLIVI